MCKIYINNHITYDGQYKITVDVTAKSFKFKYNKNYCDN